VGWAAAYIQKLRDGGTVSFHPRDNSMAGKADSGQLCTGEPVEISLNGMLGQKPGRFGGVALRRFDRRYGVVGNRLCVLHRDGAENGPSGDARERKAPEGAWNGREEHSQGCRLRRP
jgi:hypothetical protein